MKETYFRRKIGTLFNWVFKIYLHILYSFDFFRMDNNVYGSICADGWTQDWSDEVCVSMNYQGQVSESEFNTTLQDSEYFLLNSTLTPNEVSHVQAARSNFEDEPGDAAVNFECQSFGKFFLSCLD
jgi:hypothetical protein